MFFETKPETKSKFEKAEFMRFDPGMHLVKILGEPKGMFSHYLPTAKVSIKCLLDECPICKNNRQLMIENPENFRNIKGWNPKQYRHYFNVLDKTMVKVCPGCNAEVPKSGNNYPASCPSCNAIVPMNVQEQISNRVKLASISDTNATLINTQAQGYMDAVGNSYPLDQFVFMFTVIKSPDGKKTILPSVASTSKEDLSDKVLYDVEKALVNLTAEEIKDVLKGISLKDIFSARKIKTDTHEDTIQEVFDANKAISTLFND